MNMLRCKWHTAEVTSSIYSWFAVFLSSLQRELLKYPAVQQLKCGFLVFISITVSLLVFTLQKFVLQSSSGYHQG